MIDAAAIANRHLLTADGLAEAAEIKPLSVRIIVHSSWAASVAGQLLASGLVNLLCRQTKFVERIEVIADETAALVVLPNGTTGSFPNCLVSLANWAVGDQMAISTAMGEGAVDICVLVGGSENNRPISGRQLAAFGHGWLAWVGETSQAPATFDPQSVNPLGPFLAAALISGELYKCARGILRGKYLTQSGYSLWSGQSSQNWSALIDGPVISGTELPPIHLAGAGAVGNGIAYIIASAKFREAYVVEIDDDSYDSTSLNRCLLAGWRDVTQHKVLSVARALDIAGIPHYPFAGTVKKYVVDPKPGLRRDVAEAARNLAFGIVLSCVDRGISRQDVQGLHPGLLMGGSTLDLKARTNAYNLWPGSACLGCFNPAERDGEKIRALESKLSDMAPGDRRRFLEENGFDAVAIEEHLAQPKCGSVAEAALNDFAIRTAAEFSVGFVSLGAALLLASALFRHTLFADTNERHVDMTSLNFLNGGIHDAGFAADDNCELRCQSSRQDR